MKKLPLLLLLSCAFFCNNCDSVNGTTVGSSQDAQISNMSFTIDTTYISGSSLFAKGKVQNIGTATRTPPWYVEAQFYTDASYTFKLGGNSTQISVPLSPGQGTFWTITFAT